jgi:multidrug efflux pump subunit AcrB
MERPLEPGLGDSGRHSDGLWFQRFSRPTIFLIVGLAVVGAYLAFTIPVSVFPNTDFPRIVIGVDNGVAPIDQMLVTVTRPIEEAVNSVPGLQNVRSITRRCWSARRDTRRRWVHWRRW